MTMVTKQQTTLEAVSLDNVCWASTKVSRKNSLLANNLQFLQYSDQAADAVLILIGMADLSMCTCAIDAIIILWSDYKSAVLTQICK